MPAKPKHLRARAANFLGGIKRVLQCLSPRKSPSKRQRTEETEDDILKTTPSPPISPDVSFDASARDLSNATDVFLSTCSEPDNLAPGLFPAPYGAYFYQSSRPAVPTCAPQHSYQEYTLSPPKSRRATVEEVEDEGEFFPHANTSTDSLFSSISQKAEDSEADKFDAAAAADPDAQDQYVHIYDTYSAPGKLREAPTILQAQAAVKDLVAVLRGESRGAAKGYKDPDHDPFVRHRLEGMRTFLNLYIDPRSKTYGHWGASALQAAVRMGRGTHCVRTLCKLARQFISDCSLLPINPYGNWKESLLADEDLAVDINLYLQEIGNNIMAEKLMEYLGRPDVMEKHGITKTISIRTARRYLRALGYRFMELKKGQYADGHEREDVTSYRDGIYIPRITELQQRTWKYSREGHVEYGPHLPGRRVIIWYHDESIFYAHDRRRRNWYHKDAPAKLFQKGDGHSYMVADFVSQDFGWSPTSRDGTRSARRFMKPGKTRDGYFTCEDICAQANEMMDIVTEVYPEYEHVFVYDNATTHRKRVDGALSARKMPKKTPAPGKNWLVEVKANGQSTRIPMCNGEFNGQPQSLYFPEGHPRAGVFKGMAVILEERGFGDMSKKKFECSGFHCAPPALDCCCRRLLFNQPDFANVPSILETTCLDRGFEDLFLPKFHCELNFIEQCWGYAKRIYRFFPESSREDDLERNVREALSAVPLDMMRQFSNRCQKFADAYAKGLNGRQAAWAARKYRGHRMLPESIMQELEEAEIY